MSSSYTLPHRRPPRHTQMKRGWPQGLATSPFGIMEPALAPVMQKLQDQGLIQDDRDDAYTRNINYYLTDFIFCDLIKHQTTLPSTDINFPVHFLACFDDLQAAQPSPAAPRRIADTVNQYLTELSMATNSKKSALWSLNATEEDRAEMAHIPWPYQQHLGFTIRLVHGSDC
eukprot:6003950-Amphidinium_carterae.1